VDSRDHQLFTRILDFALKWEKLLEDNEDKALVSGSVVSEVLPTLLKGKSINDFVVGAAEELKQDSHAPLPMRVAVAKALVLTKAAPVSEAVDLILKSGITSRAVDVSSCRLAQTALKEFGEEGSDASTKWTEIVKQRFPLLQDFP